MKSASFSQIFVILTLNQQQLPSIDSNTHWCYGSLLCFKMGKKCDRKGLNADILTLMHVEKLDGFLLSPSYPFKRTLHECSPFYCQDLFDELSTLLEWDYIHTWNDGVFNELNWIVDARRSQFHIKKLKYDIPAHTVAVVYFMTNSPNEIQFQYIYLRSTNMNL